MTNRIANRTKNITFCLLAHPDSKYVANGLIASMWPMATTVWFAARLPGAVDEALKKLTAIDERQGRIVELRYFGGLTIEETASVPRHLRKDCQARLEPGARRRVLSGYKKGSGRQIWSLSE
jgi:hypothetical protein